MSVATFDTLAAVRNLEKAGMDTSQAEAVTETIRIAVFQGVAAKEDIGDLRTDVKADNAGLRAEFAEFRAEMREEHAKLRADLEKLRADLTWRMVLIMGTMLGLFTALDRLFLS